MTTYEKRDLDREARLAVKGLGKLLRWRLVLQPWAQGAEATLQVAYLVKGTNDAALLNVAI